MTDRAVVEFDHHDPAFHQQRHQRWAELRQCPVAHNPRYGGFWVVSGYDEVATVARDADTFSSRFLPRPTDDDGGDDNPDTHENGVDYIGIAGVPRGPIPAAGIAEVEGGMHRALRRVLNPYLIPTAVARMQPRMEQAAAWFLDQHIESGAIDLVLDYANPLPAIFTMELIGLPAHNWHHYGDLFHSMVAYRRGSPEQRRAMANIPAMLGELRAEVDDRRRAPRADLLTALVTLELDGGRQLDDDELVAALWNLIGGGLDTTTSLTSLTLHHLDAHPHLREQLVARPELLVTATEEFLRYFSVNETLTRTVTQDVELGSQQLRRGDHVMLSWLSANRDATAFERPDEVVLDRAVNPHLAFGVGPHRCIGLHLARTLFQVMVREILRRIPDYRIDHDATRFYQGNPTLAGVVEMPATFTPGPTAGPPDRPF